MLIAELARRQVCEPIRYFKPNAGQQKFINAVGKPGGIVHVFGGGNGSGKTYLIVACLGAIMWPDIAPPCFSDLPTFQKFQGPKRARIISTPKELEDVGSIQTTIKALWPRGRYTATKNGKSYLSQFTTDTGWVVDLMSYEQDVQEFAGANIGVVIFNEPMPENIFRESVARTRKGGIVLAAMTSLSQYVWVVDGILSKTEADGYRIVYSDVEDNCKEHGTNGVLEHSQIEKILAQYDPDEREARKTGKPLALSGRILKSFDRSVHVAKDELPKPKDGGVYYHVVDPAIGKPVASLWAFVDATGLVQIVDEYPDFEFFGAKDSNLTVADYVRIFREKEEGRPVQERILDRHFGNVRRTMGGITLKQEFSLAGLDFVDSYHVADGEAEVETGILKIKDYLRYDKTKPLDGLNRPRLIVSPSCRNTIAALERSSRNPKTGKQMDDGYKDFFDLVRYLVMAEPKIDTGREWGRPNPNIYA